MVIEVNKDIDRYQESVAMGLTARSEEHTSELQSHA